MTYQGLNLGLNGRGKMKVQPISSINFQCRKGSVEKIRDFGKVIQETGIINGKKLDIYSAYDKEGNLVHKLYYLADNVGNWIKSKLKYYENGKCYKVLRSERNDRKS